MGRDDNSVLDGGPAISVSVSVSVVVAADGGSAIEVPVSVSAFAVSVDDAFGFDVSHSDF